MKKLILLLFVIFCFCGIARANGDIVVNVTRITHRAIVKEDVADKGVFTYKRGGTMSMTSSTPIVLKVLPLSPLYNNPIPSSANNIDRIVTIETFSLKKIAMANGWTATKRMNGEMVIC